MTDKQNEKASGQGDVKESQLKFNEYKPKEDIINMVKRKWY